MILKQFLAALILRVSNLSKNSTPTLKNWNYASENLIGDLRLGTTEKEELRNYVVGSEFF